MLLPPGPACFSHLGLISILLVSLCEPLWIHGIFADENYVTVGLYQTCTTYNADNGTMPNMNPDINLCVTDGAVLHLIAQDMGDRLSGLDKRTFIVPRNLLIVCIVCNAAAVLWMCWCQPQQNKWGPVNFNWNNMYNTVHHTTQVSVAAGIITLLLGTIVTIWFGLTSFVHTVCTILSHCAFSWCFSLAIASVVWSAAHTAYVIWWWQKQRRHSESQPVHTLYVQA